MHHRPSQIPQASSHIPRRSSSAEPPVMTPTTTVQHHHHHHHPPASAAVATTSSSSQMNWQPANMVLHNMNMIRESIANSNRQSSIGRASSISRASMIKPDPSKNINQFELAQSISFTLQTFQLDYSPKVLLNPNTSTFYCVFEYLVQAIGFDNVWNVGYLTAQQQANNGPNKPGMGGGSMSSSQNQNQAQNNVALNKQRTELILFFLNFFEYPNIPKPSVFSTMTTPKNWIAMLQILYYLSNIVKFLSLINVNKIMYSEEKNREFINLFLSKMFARTVTVPDFVNSEEFKQQKQEALKGFRETLEKNLNWAQIVSERDELNKQHEQLLAGKNELEDLQKEEERLKREIEAEEAGLKKRQEKIDESKKKLTGSRKEAQNLSEKLRVSIEENAAKEREYEKQSASEILKRDLPKLHKQVLHELDNLENAVFDLDNKQAELQDKYANINDQLKNKITEANDLVVRIKTESAIEINNLKGIDAVLEFGKMKLMPLNDYKESIHKVRKEFNDKICRLPQKTSETKELKNAVSGKLETAKAKSTQLELETKKFDAQLNDLKKKSENALADAKLKVSQTKNEQMMKERELRAKEEEATTQSLKIKNSKDNQDKILNEADAETDEMAESFAEQYIQLLAYKEDKNRELNELKQAELTRTRDNVKQRKDRNDEIRKRLLVAGFNIKSS